MDKINISNEIIHFQAHIRQSQRIILSAKFGDGKTYFLNEVKESLADSYKFITLYPINYSVAKNEDIFEYIKRDVLLQLVNDQSIDVDFSAVVDSVFNWENLREVISFLLSFLPQGQILDKILSKAEAFKKNYDEKKNTLSKYEDFFLNQKGGIYEKDGFTQLIESTINQVKNCFDESKRKKAVLVIEDLDRIDPGHLFRILNILSAHFDENQQTNKFGFDNIILVLDYKKTERIFTHFYGENSDYNGYMSKFFSRFPFSYSIKQVAIDSICSFIEKDCGISLKSLNRIKLNENSNFEKQLSNKSIRDIAKALDNVDTQYLTEIIQVRDEVKIKTDTGFVKLISLFKLLNIDFNISELISYLSQHCSIEFLNLVGPFMFFDNNVYGNHYFYLGSNLVGICSDRKKDIITISFNDNGGGYLYKGNIQEGLYKACYKSLDYVL